ncbi:MAG: zinc-binding dehydrogenase [Deltaproteobacteria bacterium]|nr:zinc-binding dehydrogenase [Deltaproteobacteria bacterium]
MTTTTTTTYRATRLNKKGGLEALEVVSLPLEPPGPGDVVVKVSVCGAGYTDVIMRRGTYPYAPPFPFVPGYEAVGVVHAIGAGVTTLKIGQRVAALLVHGGYGEYVTRGAEHWQPVPDDVDDESACAVVLNYVTAFQMIHRAAKMQPGQTALVTGASGGVGLAMLELLRLHGVKTIGAASSSKHDLVRAMGATPIDGRGAPLEIATRAIEAQGVDVAFDALGGKTVGQCARALKKGGTLVSYGFTTAATAAGTQNLQLLRGVIALFVGTRLAGKRPIFFGITSDYRKDLRPFAEDLQKVFKLLAEKKIAPRIILRLPLLQAREAQARLEQGGVDGKILLVAGL